MKPDWNAIEADFLATGMHYADLAEKWKVPLSTLKKHAMRGKWGDRRRGVAVKAEPAASEEITPEELAIELRRQRARRMIETTDAMMDRIIDAIEVVDSGNAYALATLVKALKDLREMQGLNRTALDIEEQRARIDKLKSEIRRDEAGAGAPLAIEFVNTDGAEV